MTDDPDMLYNSIERLASAGISAAILFVVIVVLIRLLGKRATGQMSNFDWMISITVGSLAASGILLKNVSLADVILAIAVIGFLQWATAWLACRSEWFEKMVRARAPRGWRRRWPQPLEDSPRSSLTAIRARLPLREQTASAR